MRENMKKRKLKDFENQNQYKYFPMIPEDREFIKSYLVEDFRYGFIRLDNDIVIEIWINPLTEKDTRTLYLAYRKES